MSFTVVIRTLVLITLLLAVVTPIAAQDDSQNNHPLLDLLAYVPDTETARAFIYYADFHTSAETVLGEPQESTRQAWEALGYPDDLWIGWLPFTLPSWGSTLMVMMEDGGQSTGFEVTTIDRTLYFGQPPAQANILQGDFDTEAIVAAYTAESHEVQERDDVTLLCSVDGCEDGLTTDLERHNLANPFGGQLGRREPIALLDGLILNSPDINVVEAMLATGAGEESSLAESPDYQAAVAVATQMGALRQAVLLSPEHPSFWDVDQVIPLNVPAEERQILQDRVTLLPPYNLIMMADTATVDADTQAGRVLLVYDSEADANLAIEVLQTNLSPNGVTSMNEKEALHTIMTERGEMGFEVIADEATGRYIAVLSLQGPLVQLPEPDETAPTFAGMQFRLFLMMLNQRDTLWLIYDREIE
ncbi:MAG: hypothetical protein L0154_19390 [Chloroflexi bacterium]|nr:hypothetical protein [Chloroflexota bacterium]